MNNLSIVIIAMSATLLASCSGDKQNVVPASQSSLGLIVPGTDNTLTKLILLKDGRTANPVSGIPNFSSTPIGRKLALSFITGSTNNGVVDINVTKFALAQDSVFMPTPCSDSTTLSGQFKGIFTKRMDGDSSSYQAEILFDGTNYKARFIYSDGQVSPYIEGKIVISGNTIDFLGWSFVSSNENHFLLNYSLHQNNLYLWTIENGEFLGFALTKTKSLPSLFNGSFTGVVGYRVPSSNPADTATVLITHPISISFDSNNTYICSGATNSFPVAGNGTFTIKNDGTSTWIGGITFKDSVTSGDSVLNGDFQYQFSDLANQNLGLFATRNGISYSFYLHKN